MDDPKKMLHRGFLEVLDIFRSICLVTMFVFFFMIWIAVANSGDVGTVILLFILASIVFTIVQGFIIIIDLLSKIEYRTRQS